MGRSAPRVAEGYAEVIATAHRLFSLGAVRGARLLIFNAAVSAQRESADAGDLAQRPAVGRRVEAAEHLNPANDHADPSAKPAPVGGGL